MSEDKSKLQLIGEIAQANNKNLELIEEINEKEDEIERLNNIINELEEYLKSFLYMLNGILDRDIYEQCQLDDFTQIMDKLQELKDSDKE